MRARGEISIALMLDRTNEHRTKRKFIKANVNLHYMFDIMNIMFVI